LAHLEDEKGDDEGDAELILGDLNDGVFVCLLPRQQRARTGERKIGTIGAQASGGT
jgi:hypothetical protein